MAHYQPDSFTPDISVGYLLRVTNQMAAGALEHVFAEEGMSGVQWQVLLALNFAKAETCAELGRYLNHDKGAMTRLLDQMEAKGWLTRLRDADGRRLVRLALTDSGRDAARRSRDRVLACWNEWLKDWSHEEVIGLIAALTKLRGTLDRVTA